MAKIIMLKGLPASGKSSWAKQKAKEGNYFRVNKDDIREPIFGGYSKKREKNVIRIRNQLIRLGIEQGKNVIVDDTNLNPIHERTVKNLAKELGVAFEVKDDFLEVPIEECIKRDLARPNSVGPEVIWEMYHTYIAPDPVKRLEEEFDKPRCVIFDVDGTLAHNLSGRDIYDYSRVMEDTPDPFVSYIVDKLGDTQSFYADIIIVSGRDDSCRKETEEWLDANMIPYTHLYMRESGDKRPDYIIKEELYHKYIEPEYCVLGVFDDRPVVCDMWRKLGLKVAQMANPYIRF